MHSAIFAVDMPPDSDRQKWFRYLAVVAPKIERAAVERIAEKCLAGGFSKITRGAGASDHGGRSAQFVVSDPGAPSRAAMD